MSSPLDDRDHGGVGTSSQDGISRIPDTAGLSVAVSSVSQRAHPLFKYVAIARPHHYPKNLLVIAGFLLACFHQPEAFHTGLLWLVGAGIAATCLIASSNYVLNEILDAASDRFHPLKDGRPIAAGDISPAVAYFEWFVLAATGQAIAAWIGPSFFAIAVIFQFMSLVYNVPPVRLKDIPYVDVLCEAVNSPLRLLLGWVLLLPAEPPGLELVLAFWMAGAWEMARERLRELRFLENRTVAAAYRKSFLHYDAARLLASMFVYAALTAVFCLLAGRTLFLSPEL